MSDGRADRESELPTEEELITLPRWARVAFAVRCAERVRPLFKYFWREAPEKVVEGVDRAVMFAKASATSPASVSKAIGTAAYSVEAARAYGASYNRTDARAAAEAARAASEASEAAYADAAAHAAARYDTYARAAAAARTAAARAVRAARAAAHHDKNSVNARQDYELLRMLARGVPGRPGNNPTPWTDETPVNPDLLGPLWPFGEPEGWPEEAKEPRAGDQRLQIRLVAPPNASDKDIADAMAELVRRMDNLHRAMGGSGLVIDDEAEAFDECLVFQPAGGGA